MLDDADIATHADAAAMMAPYADGLLRMPPIFTRYYAIYA